MDSGQRSPSSQGGKSAISSNRSCKMPRDLFPAFDCWAKPARPRSNHCLCINPLQRKRESSLAVECCGCWRRLNSPGAEGAAIKRPETGKPSWNEYFCKNRKGRRPWRILWYAVHWKTREIAPRAHELQEGRLPFNWLPSIC